MSAIELRGTTGSFGVRLAEDVVAVLLERCRLAGMSETGGFLVGQYNARHDCAEVLFASDAPPDSRRGARWFTRGIAGVRRLLRRAWRRKEYYLGEWHFHPGGRAVPSARDDRQMKGIATSPRYACPEPILLLVGYHDKRWEIGVFVYPAGARRVRLGGDPVYLSESALVGAARPRDENVEV